MYATRRHKKLSVFPEQVNSLIFESGRPMDDYGCNYLGTVVNLTYDMDWEELFENYMGGIVWNIYLPV